ncbi:hypothetical protein BJY01DRAFT_242805 [Aspergillus pseudoustus]|uniref:Nephrocystin 3-like N-terminal domain-containing protein n=1 Tax=Aspergillus pseudoustus TaxID=1810923 RepID=A0ABR4KYX2_9EURO
MDPVSIFGIVVNIATLIDLTHKVITIYKDGAGSNLARLVESADEMDSLCQRLQSSHVATQAGSGSISGSAEADLQECANRCIQTAAALRKELDLPAAGQQSSRRRRAFHSLKVQFSRKIPMLEWELRDLHEQLDTNLLVRIRESIDVNETKQSDQFKSLDASIQALFVQFFDRQTTTLDLVLDRNTRKILDHIESVLRDQVEEAARRDVQQRKGKLLESLVYGNPFTRPNDILGKHDGTFEWIFDKGSGSSFPVWLRSPAPGDIFWIQGKPGSGKSTLMKSIAMDKDRVNRYLMESQPAKRPVIFTFYFWLADTMKLQNTEKGLLCSLLSQFLETRWTLDSSYLSDANLRQKKTQANWDPVELRTLVSQAVDDLIKDHCICIFIDALDECQQADLTGALSIIKQFSRGEVKLCVSSRPEQRIIVSLRQTVTSILKVENFTRRDIAKFVRGELDETDIQTAGLSRQDLNDLSTSITGQADGVFLWATLVSKDLRNGIENGDNIGQLYQRLNQMPGDLNALYRNMLQRLGSDHDLYMTEAASYFGLVLQRRLDRVDAYNALLAHFVRIYHKFRRSSSICQKLDLDLLQRVEDRINTVCIGMLVCRAPNMIGRGHIPSPYARSVGFFHRTARDFILDTGNDIMQSGVTVFEIYTSITFGYLMMIGLLETPDEMARYSESAILESSVSSLKREEKVELLLHVDKTLGHIYEAKHWVYKQWPYAFASSIRQRGFLDLVGASMSIARDSSLLERLLSSDAPLSRKYKSYLLFLACGDVRAFKGSITTLLETGAYPNTSMYLSAFKLRGVRIKSSPWIQFLESGKTGIINPALVKSFLGHGADLSATLTWFVTVLPDFGVLSHRSDISFYTGRVSLILYVNARFLLETFFGDSIGEEVWPGAGGSPGPTELYCSVVGVFLGGAWKATSPHYRGKVYFYPVADEAQSATTSEAKSSIQRVFDHILGCVFPQRKVENWGWVVSTINEYVAHLQRVEFVAWALKRGEMIESNNPASMFADYENFRGPDGDIDLDALFAD